jgi:hypothetical protein
LEVAGAGGHGDVGERRELLHVHIDAALAVEQSVDLGAHRVLEGGLAEALRLRLAGHDQPRRIRDRGFERLPGEEDDRRLHDGEDEGQERRRDQAEFNRRGAVLLAREAPYGAWRRRSGDGRLRELLVRELQHGRISDELAG